MSEWVQACPAWARTAVVADSEDGAVLLLAQAPSAQQAELWRWTGEEFHLERVGVFAHRAPGTELFGVLAGADRHAGGVLLCGLTAEGLVVTGRADTAPVQEMQLPDRRHHSRDLVGVARLGADLLVLAADGTVYAERKGKLRRVGEPIPGEVRLCGVVPDALRGLVAWGAVSSLTPGSLWTWTPDDGWRSAVAADVGTCAMAWNPWQERVEALRQEETLSPMARLRNRRRKKYERNRRHGRSMWLAAWDAEVDDRAGPCLDGGGFRVRLVADEPARSWLAIREWQVLVAESGRDFQAVPDPWARDALRWHTRYFAGAAGPLRALADRAEWSLFRLDAQGWIRTPIPSPLGPRPHHAWTVHTAAGPNGVFILDDGMLFLLGDDGDLRVLAEAWGGLGGLLAADRTGAGDQVSMVYDSAGDRLVLWIGVTRQTWIFHGNRWNRLPGQPAPPTGFPRLCATDLGVYCLAGGELWLLTGDRWTPVGRDPEWAARLLFARPGRPGLWSINERQVGVWRDSQFHAMATLPPGITPPGDPAPVEGTDDRDLILSAVCYDPVGDRLLASGIGGVWHARMAALEAPDTGLPPPRPNKSDGIDEKGAVEEAEAGSFSTFLFEYSVSPGGARQADVIAYPDLGRIIDATAEMVGVQDQAGASAELRQNLMLTTVLDGWTLHLWVVQRGVLAQGIDLWPYVIAQFDDGTRIDLGSDRHELLRGFAARKRYPIGLAVNRAALAAAVPALRRPLLEPDGLIVLRFDGSRPDPDTFSYLDYGERVHFGYQDLEGNLTAEEERAVNEGIDFPSSFDDVRELDNDGLRQLGWNL